MVWVVCGWCGCVWRWRREGGTLFSSPPAIRCTIHVTSHCVWKFGVSTLHGLVVALLLLCLLRLPVSPNHAQCCSLSSPPCHAHATPATATNHSTRLLSPHPLSPLTPQGSLASAQPTALALLGFYAFHFETWVSRDLIPRCARDAGWRGVAFGCCSGSCRYGFPFSGSQGVWCYRRRTHGGANVVLHARRGVCM